MRLHCAYILAMASLALAGSAYAFDQPKVYDLKPNEGILILGDSTTLTVVMDGHKGVDLSYELPPTKPAK